MHETLTKPRAGGGGTGTALRSRWRDNVKEDTL